MSGPADEILSLLRANRIALQARGVLHVAIFGSVARGEARPDSDLDLMVDIDPHRRLNVFDFVDMRLSLSGILGRKVDLVEKNALKSIIREEVMRERLDAF